MAGKFKSTLSVVLIILLTFYGTIFPVVTYADELNTIEAVQADKQVSLPSQESTTSLDSSVAEVNTVESQANTGDNIIADPILTLTPTPVENLPLEEQELPVNELPIEPTVEVNMASEVTPTLSEINSSAVSIDNLSNVSNNIVSEGNTGENNIATNSSQLETNPKPSEQIADPDTSCVVPESLSGNITTGNAVSEVSVDNSINTNSINSQFVYQTINIFVNETGNLNLSDPFAVASSLIPQYPNNEVINVSFTNVNNYSYLENNIISSANSGNNLINTTSQGQAIINTGDSYSIVSLVNKVNFTIVNSVVHIVSINIFGKLNGNIILPDINPTATSCSTCGFSLAASNSATVVNNINSKADSGQNNINGNGSISSADAESSVNNLNLVNSNFIGTSVSGLFINLIGNWTGNFIGWNGFSQTGGASLAFYSASPFLNNGLGCQGCIGDINVSSKAYVENNITSFANSGGNVINGNGDITTGNAFSSISLINFVNTNFIDSIGFFGFLNIFGELNGDIGGASNFDKLNDVKDEPVTEAKQEFKDQKQEEGGLLTVTQSNNVGQYVFPGDTVTFFIKVKNPGKGKVYGTKLKLLLVKDGQAKGGGLFEIGDIEAGKSIKITTGLVLSKKAEAGEYFAIALAQGQIGPDNQTISASQESSFKVFGGITQGILATSNDNPQVVLGTKSSNKAMAAGQTREMTYLILLIMVISAYSVIRTYRKREHISKLFLSKISLKDRLTTLKMFLF